MSEFNNLGRYNEEATDVAVRSQETIATEIKVIVSQAQKTMLDSAVEIGRRLVEAKELVSHGEWGDWLSEKVNFSKSTANNFMRIFEGYGDKQITIFGAVSNRQALGDLSYTKALALLAVPEEEREEFTKEVDVENISTRELEKKIKELEASRDDFEKTSANLNEQLKRQEILARVAESKVKKLEEELQEIESLKAEEDEEAADSGIDEEEVQRRIDESMSHIKEKLSDLQTEKLKANEEVVKAKEKLEALKASQEKIIEKAKEEAKADANRETEEELAKLKRAAEEAREKLKDAERKAGLAGDQNIQQFKFLINELQKDYHSAAGVISGLADKEQQDKMKLALKTLLEKLASELV